MESTKASKQRKKPGGIALRPVLWERIRRLAEERDISANQVMEDCLTLHLPAVADFRKSEEDIDPAQTVEFE